MTSSRNERVFATLAFAFGLAWIVGIMLVYSQRELVEGEVRYVLGDGWRYDINAYVHAAARLGSDGSLYLQEQIQASFTPSGEDYYHYSPPLGVALTPLTGLEEHAASVVWYVLKTMALLAACLLMPVGLPTRALTFAAVAISYWALRDLVLGNVGVLLLLPMAIAWRWLDRPLGSFGLALTISVRPSTGALLIWQLLRRSWRVAAWTIASGVVLIIVSALFVGVEGYRDYFAVLGNMAVPGAWTENRDLGATLVRLGLDQGWMGLVRAASIAIGVVLILLGLRRDKELGFMITLAASMLLVPLMWEYYLLMLALPLALLAHRWHPAVLLILVLSWLPSPTAQLPLWLTIAALFLLPNRLPKRTADEPKVAEGLPA